MNIYTDTIIPYVYKLTHKITGQFYFGARWANKIAPIDDLWKKYFYSSAYVKLLIDEYGKDSFITEIVFTDINGDVCYHYEQKLIEDHWNDKLILNKTYYEKGSKIFKNSGHSEISCEKIRLANLGKKHTEESKLKMSEMHKGKKHTEESKAKISEAGRNRPPVSVETRKKLSESNKGKILTNETRAKMSQAHKDKKYTIKI